MATTMYMNILGQEIIMVQECILVAVVTSRIRCPDANFETSLFSVSEKVKAIINIAGWQVCYYFCSHLVSFTVIIVITVAVVAAA
eukprot:15332925-Ditylum_brightwellii.AAC.1